jgi:hypothetical protein
MITFMRGNHTFKAFPTLSELLDWNRTRTDAEVYGFEMFSINRGRVLLRKEPRETYPDFVIRAVRAATVES